MFSAFHDVFFWIIYDTLGQRLPNTHEIFFVRHEPHHDVSAPKRQPAVADAVKPEFISTQKKHLAFPRRASEGILAEIARTHTRVGAERGVYLKHQAEWCLKVLPVFDAQKKVVIPVHLLHVFAIEESSISNAPRAVQVPGSQGRLKVPRRNVLK